jgi:hypothetical protein
MAIKVNVSDKESKSGEWVPLPSGRYHVVITDVEQAPSQSANNFGKPLFKFRATVQDGQYADKVMTWTACLWNGALYTIIGVLKAIGEYENCMKGGTLSIPDAPEFYITRHLIARRGVNKKAKEENPEDDPINWVEVRGFEPYKEGDTSTVGAMGKAATSKASSVLP